MSSSVSSEEWQIVRADPTDAQEESVHAGCNALFSPVFPAPSWAHTEGWEPDYYCYEASTLQQFDLAGSWIQPSSLLLNNGPLQLETGPWNPRLECDCEHWAVADGGFQLDGSCIELTTSLGLNESCCSAVCSHGVESACFIDNSLVLNNAATELLPTGRASSSSKGRRCDWPDCSSEGPFNTAEENKLHIKSHARFVRDTWKLGERCTWYGCSSKALHKTATLFEKHLNNIHVNPLICTAQDCNHKTPFRANAELQRHIASVHAEKRCFKCPYKSCELDRKVFSRRDKLVCHLRSFHSTHACPYANCLIWKESLAKGREGTAKHITKRHGEYECALKSCKGSISQFLESSLLDHLQMRHDMDWELALRARDAAKGARDYVLKDEHVTRNVDA